MYTNFSQDLIKIINSYVSKQLYIATMIYIHGHGHHKDVSILGLYSTHEKALSDVYKSIDDDKNHPHEKTTDIKLSFTDKPEGEIIGKEEYTIIKTMVYKDRKEYSYYGPSHFEYKIQKYNIDEMFIELSGYVKDYKEISRKRKSEIKDEKVNKKQKI